MIPWESSGLKIRCFASFTTLQVADAGGLFALFSCSFCLDSIDGEWCQGSRGATCDKQLCMASRFLRPIDPGGIGPRVSLKLLLIPTGRWTR